MLILGWDFSEKNEHDTLIVMRSERGNKMEVINTFYDQDAHDIYKMLTKKSSLEKKYEA